MEQLFCRSGGNFLEKRSGQEKTKQTRIDTGEESAMQSAYLVLDIETTGLDPKTEKIIEIGAARVRDGQVVETYQTFVNPGRKLTERIVELTGITDDMLCDAPYIETALPAFLVFAGEDVLLGHSVRFDYSFLKRAAVNLKCTFEKKAVDTLKLARLCLPELPSRSLGALCGHYEITHTAHRALGDALATHVLYQKLCAQFEAADQAQPYVLTYKVKKEGPITPAQRERLLKMLEYYEISPPCEIDRMTKNEASRMMDKLMLTYGKMRRDTGG